MAVADREKALEAALAQIEKAHGKGSVMRLGDEVAVADRGHPDRVDRARRRARHRRAAPRPGGRDLRPGVLRQDHGGAARHRQRPAGRRHRAFIDAEHALDPDYAQKLGVDTDELLVSQPDNGEQALEIADMLVRSGALDVIVIDSVAALTPRAEIEGEMGDTHVGLQARLMSQALRKMTGRPEAPPTPRPSSSTSCARRSASCSAARRPPPAASALKFYASVRLDVRRIETLKDGTEAVGNRTRVKVVKNKVAPPFKQAEFDIIYGQGISREGSLIDMGVELGIIRKAGAWFTYDGDQLGQGKENARNFLRDNPDLADEIEKKIKEKLGIGATLEAAVDLTAAVPVTI